MNRQVLIVSFWNPTEKHPQQGVFIKDQAAAVCSKRENVVFLQVNVLPSKHLTLRKEIIQSAFYKNRTVIINLYSIFWKFFFVNPWIMARIVYRILDNSFPDIKPALIHSNVVFPCGIVSYLISKKTGSELIISEHWSKAEKLLKHSFYKKIALKAYLKNSAVICVSEYLAEKIAETTGHKNIIVIPNIVDTQIFSYKSKPEFDGKSLNCICIATWKPPKRLDLIIDSLCRFVAESGCNVYLDIVGNGIQTEALKTISPPENLHITRHGYLEKQEIAALLWKSHIFLHASEIETFSIVTAEALSTGTPVLVSNAGALPELVHDRNGLLTDNNPEAWNSKLQEIAAKRFDYESISQENQIKFSPSAVGNAILEEYKKILKDTE
jgi:glycosyltransferase involved in cell wall biosynthesis